MRPKKRWTKNAQKNPIKYVGLLIVLSLMGCREFYDEEFEEFEATRTTQTANVSYEAELESTDPTLVGLQGDVSINVREEDVEVRVDLNGLPQNIINPHYSFITADCSTQNFSIPNDLGTTRSFNFSENITTTALESDLRATGAGGGDINLEGKSIIIKAFSNLTSLPDTSGVNSIVIACGEIMVTSDGASTTFDTTTTGGAGDGTTIGGAEAGDVFETGF